MGKSDDDNKNDFIAAVAGFIDRSALLRPGERVLVALSGGPDSVALLAALRELGRQRTRRYKISAAHLNHQLRDGADADERFVKKLCAGWKIPCTIKRLDVKALAAQRGESVETAAREARYEFLAAAAAGQKAAVVATAHHADDNVETIVHRIFRGTHLRGLCGIARVRSMAGGVRVIRPLLGRRRGDIERFLAERNLKYCTDPTNAQSDYRRNYIRNELLPLIRRELNPQADEAVLRLAQAAGEVQEYLCSSAKAATEQALCGGDDAGKNLLALDAKVLSRQPAIIRKYVLREAAGRMGLAQRDITAEHFEQFAGLFKSGGGAIVLPGGIVVRKRAGRVIFANESAAADEVMTPVAIKCPGRTQLPDDRAITCTIEPMDRAAFARHCRRRPPGVELIDADKVHLPLVCRSRRKGDSLRPLGCKGRQSVSDFLTNQKLPPQRRKSVFCVCDGQGIVYLAPLRIADRVKAGKATRRVMRIEISAS